MPIQSYLVYPRQGQKQTLLSILNQTVHCRTLESLNNDVLILVTDTLNNEEEEILQENLKLIPQIQQMALVYAQED